MLGRIIMVIGVLAVIIVSLGIIFSDELFTKEDAIKLLSEQHIILEDDFKILSNESMSAPGDYYHTFTLEISKRDKQRFEDIDD